MRNAVLADNDAIATVAVKDLSIARAFYGDALGLVEQPDSDNPQVITYASGNSKLGVYASQFAGTNKATSVTWAVGELEPIVETLRAKGVTFEHYDLPQLTLRGDIHVAADGFQVVWFKDPDGNILSILSAPGR
jgi:catechol 2,3-dioxygenase-like lactoylglutathione lyase family enzyme